MIRIYDSGHRGECRTERPEHIDAISWLKHNHPDRWPLIFHPPNETRGKGNHHIIREKEGVKSGPPDIIDLGGVVGLFEMKRMDRTRSSISKEQRAFLQAGADAGHFAAICYGFEQFKLAYADYLEFVRLHS